MIGISFKGCGVNAIDRVRRPCLRAIKSCSASSIAGSSGGAYVVRQHLLPTGIVGALFEVAPNRLSVPLLVGLRVCERRNR